MYPAHKNLHDHMTDQVHDALAALKGQLHTLEWTIDSLKRSIAGGRMLNTLGEIQGQANKVDACVARYQTARAGLAAVDAFLEEMYGHE